MPHFGLEGLFGQKRACLIGRKGAAEKTANRAQCDRHGEDAPGMAGENMMSITVNPVNRWR